MFFHALLLHPQHKMQLHLPWIAATLGVKRIKKDDLIKCNVVKVCDHIIIFVTSDSLNPHKRFSLRLSAILISGVCKILRQQVILLRDEIDRSLADREKIAERLLLALEDVETQPTPKPKIKKKKGKPQQAGTPESLVGRIDIEPRRGGEERVAEPEFTLEPLYLPEEPVDEAILQSRVAEITLREEKAGPQQPQLIDDFGPIEEEPMPLPSELQSTSAAPELMVSDVLLAEQPVIRPSRKEKTPERIEQDLPQIQVEKVSEKEPVIQVMPEVEAIPTPQLEKQADKRISPIRTKERSDLDQLRIVELEPRESLKTGGKNIVSFLLIKRKKKKFVFINQVEQIYKDQPNFIPITRTIPGFKPVLKFWPDWQLHLDVEVARPSRYTMGSMRVSSHTEGSVRLGVDKSAGTPEISASSMPLAQQIETPSEVATPGPTYVSTPRKRPLPGDETIEEVLPPAANGVMGPPEMLSKKRKVVSIEEVQAAEQLDKDGIPEDQLVIPQEPPEIQQMVISEVSEMPPPDEHRRPERISPEKQVYEDAEGRIGSPRQGYQQIDFGVKWSKDIIEVIYKHDKIGAEDICRALQKRLTKLNMSVVFATLLTLAKDRYVLLHSAEDSCELEFIVKGPKEFIF